MMGSDGRHVYWATTVEYQGRLSTQIATTPDMSAACIMAAMTVADDLNMDGVKITQSCHHGHQPDEPCSNVPVDIIDLQHCDNQCAYYDMLEVVRRRTSA